MMTTNEARVIKIPNEYSIVVNAGKNDGVNIGENLEIYVKGEKVVDPFSNKELGTLDFIKARVEVTTLYENMCVCKNIEYSALHTIMSSINELQKGPRKELAVDENEISGDFSKFDRTIKIGDFVRPAL